MIPWINPCGMYFCFTITVPTKLLSVVSQIVDVRKINCVVIFKKIRDIRVSRGGGLNEHKSIHLIALLHVRQSHVSRCMYHTLLVVNPKRRLRCICVTAGDVFLWQTRCSALPLWLQINYSPPVSHAATTPNTISCTVMLIDMHTRTHTRTHTSTGSL